MLQHIINYLSTVNYAQAGETITSFLAAGGGLSVLIQLLKRTRKWESSSFIQLMLGAFGLLAATADVVIKHSGSGDPLALLFGHVWPTLVVAAMVMHRLAINPLTNLVEKSIVSTLKDAKAYRAEKATVAPPVIVEPPVDQFN